MKQHVLLNIEMNSYCRFTAHVVQETYYIILYIIVKVTNTIFLKGLIKIVFMFDGRMYTSQQTNSSQYLKEI